jgi:hypothetical protein
VTTPEIAAGRGLAAASVLATIERHNAFPEDPVQLRGGWAMDIDQFWASAGITPDEVNTLQVYDDYPVIVAMQLPTL